MEKVYSDDAIKLVSMFLGVDEQVVRDVQSPRPSVASKGMHGRSPFWKHVRYSRR